MLRRFQQVDVFASGPCSGNPVAVVLDGAGLTTEQMQQFANWTNLSETTFVLPPSTIGADYAVRIFTPFAELPFAGHPTLGTCHAWLTSGGDPRDPEVVVQECGVGPVRIRRTDDRLAFAAPPLVRSGPVDEDHLARMVSGLGIQRGDVIDSNWVDNGPGWVALLLDDADAVLALEPRFEDEPQVDVGVVGFHPDGSDAQIEVRAFFRDGGPLMEDPVTGSLNASLAQWLIGSGRISAPYVASQGRLLGRAGRVYVDHDADGEIWIGGRTDTVLEGTAEI